MTKEDILKEWGNILFNDVGTDNPVERARALEVLNAVYDVGFAAGKDAQKLEKQLGVPGKPKEIK